MNDTSAAVPVVCADCRQPIAAKDDRLLIGDRVYHATCGPSHAKLSTSTEKGEAVAWRIDLPGSRGFTEDKDHADMEAFEGADVTPLYASPPSDGEARRLLKAAHDWIIPYAGEDLQAALELKGMIDAFLSTPAVPDERAGIVASANPDIDAAPFETDILLGYYGDLWETGFRHKRGWFLMGSNPETSEPADTPMAWAHPPRLSAAPSPPPEGESTPSPTRRLPQQEGGASPRQSKYSEPR